MTHCHGVKKYCYTSNTLSELCCTCGENGFMTPGHFMGNCNLQCCHFFSLFLCFLTTEWAITQARAGPCVCGIQGSGIHSACFLWGKGAVKLFAFRFCQQNRSAPWFSRSVFFHHVDAIQAKGLAGEPWEQWWHQSQPRFPSSGSGSQLQRAEIVEWDTTGRGYT